LGILNYTEIITCPERRLDGSISANELALDAEVLSKRSLIRIVRTLKVSADSSASWSVEAYGDRKMLGERNEGGFIFSLKG
jgi:hypothetical protein